MKFLCDEMLAHLGRWLRIAGYDAEIVASGSDDKDILQKAIDTNRTLLTRDKMLLTREGAAKRVIWLKTNELEHLVKELSKKMKVNWLHRPFSRCLECNVELRTAKKTEIEKVPESIRDQYREFRACPSCERLYWDGSHYDRMHERLKEWKKTA